MSEIPFHNMKIWRETSKEYIYFCPFCNERSSHGHLYISKKFPVYYCFKCNCSGHLNQLSKFIHEQCHIEYNSTIEYNLPYLDISKILYETEELLRAYSLAITNAEKEYFRKRSKLKNITMDNIVKFSLFPDSYAHKILKLNYDNNPRTWTLRGFSTGLSGRIHDNNSSALRYINGDVETPWHSFINNDTYFIRNNYIRNYNSSNIPETIIIAEGVYDIVSIFLHRKKYNVDGMFFAVQCSNYARALNVFKLLFNSIPRNIMVFADSGIKVEFLKEQFKDYKNSKVSCNWPMIKDWEEAGPVKYMVEF